MRLPPVIARHPALWVAGAAAAVLGWMFLGLRGAMQGAAPGSGAGGAPFAGPSDRVLLIGDSLAFGLKKPMQDLAQASGIEFKGRGVVGSRIDEWDNKYLAEELAGYSPTVAIVSLGTNDMKMFNPSEQQREHLASLLQKLRAAGARVAWIVPPTMPFGDKGVRQMIADAAPDLVIRADLLTLTRAEDKIHMTPSGYKAFAGAVWSCVTAGACP